MAKYYVFSGTVRMIVDALAPDNAALWAVHRVMQQVLPVADDDGLSPQAKQIAATRQDAMVLGSEIQVSQSGFDAVGESFNTADVVTEWSQLVAALAKIEELAARGQVRAESEMGFDSRPIVAEAVADACPPPAYFAA